MNRNTRMWLCFLFVLTGCERESKDVADPNDAAPTLPPDGSTHDDNVDAGGVDADVEDDAGETPSRPRNVILFVADDYGAISAEAYADQWDSARYAPTPTVRRICEQGVRFTRAWSYPTCSPTRASIMTGHYGFRTGVGAAIVADGERDGIQPGERSLARVLDVAGAPHARLMSGKWHLGSHEAIGGDDAPSTFGWQRYAGSLTAAPEDHYEWDRTENGVTAPSTTYTSTQEVDDALRFLEARDPDQPFVLWHAFAAAHAPLQKPPVELHDYDDLAETGASDIEYFEAMVQAMDTEMARLLAALPDEDGDGLPDDTTIFFVSDNGSSDIGGPIPQASANTLPPPYEEVPAKGTLYEHGYRVPLCVAGAGVARPGRDVAALVHTVDLHATILELAGVDPAAAATSDSVSLASILAGEESFARDFQFTEQFNIPIGAGAALSDGSFKWIRTVRPLGFNDECFDVTADPLEERNLVTRRGTPAGCVAVRDRLLELVCSEPDGQWQDWCE